MVPKEGLEPSCLATHAPETCVSTNSTTSVKYFMPAEFFKVPLAYKLGRSCETGHETYLHYVAVGGVRVYQPACRRAGSCIGRQVSPLR